MCVCVKRGGKARFYKTKKGKKCNKIVVEFLFAILGSFSCGGRGGKQKTL